MIEEELGSLQAALKGLKTEKKSVSEPSPA